MTGHFKTCWIPNPELNPEAVRAVCALSLDLVREERFFALDKIAALPSGCLRRH